MQYLLAWEHDGFGSDPLLHGERNIYLHDGFGSDHLLQGERNIYLHDGFGSDPIVRERRTPAYMMGLDLIGSYRGKDCTMG